VRERLRARIQELLPDFEVGVTETTVELGICFVNVSVAAFQEQDRQQVAVPVNVIRAGISEGEFEDVCQSAAHGLISAITTRLHDDLGWAVEAVSRDGAFFAEEGAPKERFQTGRFGVRYAEV